MGVLDGALRARKGRRGIAEVFANGGAVDVGSGIQNPGHHRGVCRGSPCRQGIAAEELRDTGHGDAVFETDRLAF